MLQMFKTVFKDVTVGVGHVNDHLYPAKTDVFPLPAHYVESAWLPEQQESAEAMKTTNKLTFMPR